MTLQFLTIPTCSVLPKCLFTLVAIFDVGEIIRMWTISHWYFLKHRDLAMVIMP